MEDQKYVVGMGEVLWDMLPAGKQIGGAPANFAYHVGKLGHPSYIVSAIGADNDGKEIIETLNKRQLNHLLANVPNPTGRVEITLDAEGIPQYDIKQHVAWDNIPFTPELEALAKHTCAVCFGSLAQRESTSRDTIRRFLDAMPKDNDTLIVFDINLRQNFYTKEILEESIKLCNILKINDEELVTIGKLAGWPDLDPEGACSILLGKYNLKAVILTCGANGSYVFTPDETSALPTPEVEVEDTVGAGDSFTAAFVTGLLDGKSIREAHKMAVDTAAFVCTQKGAMPEYE